MLRHVDFLIVLLFSCACAIAQPIRDTREDIRKARVYQILVKEQASAASLRQQLQPLDAAVRFAQFRRYARLNSIDTESAEHGGDLGVVWQGELVKAFDEIVFAAPLGQMVGPFQTQLGWHLIWVTDFQTENVGTLCEGFLRTAIRKASPADARVLEASVASTARGPLAPRVARMLGTAWGSPHLDAQRNPLFLARPIPQDAGLRTVQVHVDYVHPWLRASSDADACVRSRRESYTLDCRARKVALADVTDYEGRGASGAVVARMQFNRSLEQTAEELRAVPEGTLGAQVLAHGCGG